MAEESQTTAGTNGVSVSPVKTVESSTTKEVKVNGENPLKNGSDGNQTDEGAQAVVKGNRCLAITDYEGAIEAYATACELLIPVHGELGEEMVDIYFNYGRALLNYARTQNGVLGDKIQNEEEEQDEGDDDDDEDEEEEQENPEDEKKEHENKVDEKKEPENKVDEKKEPENKVDEKEEPENKVEEKKEPDGEKNTADKNDSTKEKSEDNNPKADEEKKEDEGNAEDEENADDLQLSWQFLDMARVILERKTDDTKETQIKLAEVFLSLGENGLEAESYDTAMSDIDSCLIIQRAVLSDDDRRIAETLFQKGVAYSLNKDYANAAKLFSETIAQLEKKIETLKGSNDNEEEITDIKEAIKEISEKIADVRASEESLKTSLAAKLTGSLLEQKSESPKPSSSKSISDISHLIRKKRKNDEEAVDEKGEEKKPKLATEA